MRHGLPYDHPPDPVVANDITAQNARLVCGVKCGGGEVLPVFLHSRSNGLYFGVTGDILFGFSGLYALANDLAIQNDH